MIDDQLCINLSFKNRGYMLGLVYTLLQFLTVLRIAVKIQALNYSTYIIKGS